MSWTEFYSAGELDWTVSVEEKSPRSWKLVEGLSPEVIYEMKVIARNSDNPLDGVESCSSVERVRINMKRGKKCDNIKPPYLLTTDYFLCVYNR